MCISKKVARMVKKINKRCVQKRLDKKKKKQCFQLGIELRTSWMGALHSIAEPKYTSVQYDYVHWFVR